MLSRTPSFLFHTAMALPLAFMAICGLAVLTSSVSIGAAAPQPLPGVKRLAQTLFFAPSDWNHTAIALPLASTATCGAWESPAVGIGISVAAPQPLPTV